MNKGESLSSEVAKAINLVDRSGLKYQVTAMGTLVEGDWDEVMGLIKLCHDIVRKGSKRVYTRISIDDKEGVTDAITGKVTSVERKIGRGIRK